MNASRPGSESILRQGHTLRCGHIPSPRCAQVETIGSIRAGSENLRRRNLKFPILA